MGCSAGPTQNFRKLQYWRKSKLRQNMNLRGTRFCFDYTRRRRQLLRTAEVTVFFLFVPASYIAARRLPFDFRYTNEIEQEE